jgi:hypothetical protein
LEKVFRQIGSSYVRELARCGEQLSRAGTSLHPALTPTPIRRARRERGAPLASVLFLCTGQ